MTFTNSWNLNLDNWISKKTSLEVRNNKFKINASENLNEWTSALTCDCTPVFTIEKFFEEGAGCPTIRVTLTGLAGQDCTCDVLNFAVLLKRDISLNNPLELGTFVITSTGIGQDFLAGPGINQLPGMGLGCSFARPNLIATASGFGVGEFLDFSYQTDSDDAEITISAVLSCSNGLNCPNVSSSLPIDIFCI